MSESLCPEFIIATCVTQIFYIWTQSISLKEVFSSEHKLFHAAKAHKQSVCVCVCCDSDGEWHESFWDDRSYF